MNSISMNHDIYENQQEKSKVLVQTKIQQTTLNSNSQNQLSAESHEEKNQVYQNKFKNNNRIMEQHEIASRIVKPQPIQQMRQIIDSLCMKEKNFIYQNPNFREDCIGTQNTIFDLEKSHLVNRPGVLSKQERQITTNQQAQG